MFREDGILEIGKMLEEYLTTERLPIKINVWPYTYSKFIDAKDTIHSSELAKCAREVYYQSKHSKDMPASVRMIFLIGTLTHELIQGILPWLVGKNTPNGRVIKVENEKEMFLVDPMTKTRIVCHVDAILYYDTGKIHVLELKSTKEMLDLKQKASPDHVTQSQLYSAIIGADIVQVSYVEKNSFAVKDFKVEINPSILKWAYERAEILKNSKFGSVLPLAESKFNSDKKWMCGYCRYKNLCDNNEL